MNRAYRKNELRIFFLLLFAVPVINILIFQGTTSLASAAIIMSSLVIFLLIALINLDRIVEGMREFQRGAVEEETRYARLTDALVTDILSETEKLKKEISKLPSQHLEPVSNSAGNLLDIVSGLRKVSAVTFKEITVNHPEKRVIAGDKNPELTPIEFELLWVLILKKGRVLSREYLLDRVWGYDYLGASRTVDMAVARLRKKLAGSSKYIKTVKGFGYTFRE